MPKTLPDDKSDPGAEVQIVDGDPAAVDIYLLEGPLAWYFKVRRIIYKGGEVNAYVSLDWKPSNPRDADALRGHYATPLHINWRSSSALEGHARGAQRLYDPDKKLKIPFPDLYMRAARQVERFLVSPTSAVRRVDGAASFTPASYLIKPIWPNDLRPVVWFGQGESLKGTLAAAAGFCLTEGMNLAALPTKPTGRIMYLDWEDFYDEFNRRVTRLANAVEIAPRGGLVHYDARGRPFVDAVDVILQNVEELGGVDAYIIDSAIPACGGDVNDAEPVGAFFGAVSQLKRPTLILAHETKAGNAEFPFGSQLWRTMPSMNVNFQGGEDKTDFGGQISRDLLLKCTKSNNVRRFQEIALRVAFSDDERGEAQGETYAPMTWITRINADDVGVELQAKLPARRQIVNYLRADKAGGGYTAADIAEATGLSPKSVDGILRRTSDLFWQEARGTGRGNAAVWHLRPGTDEPNLGAGF